MNFEKKERENLHDAWSYKRLVRACPHHGIPECILMEVFYDGLNKMAHVNPKSWKNLSPLK